MPTIAIVVCSRVSGASLVHKQLARLQHNPRAPTGLMSGGWTLPSHVVGVRARGAQRDVGWCRAPRPIRFPGTVPSTLDQLALLSSRRRCCSTRRTRVRRVELLLHRVPCDGGHRTPTCSHASLAALSSRRRRHAHLLTPSDVNDQVQSLLWAILNSKAVLNTIMGS